MFSDRGVVYALPAYRVPQCSRTAKGTPVVQLLPIPREEAITSLISAIFGVRRFISLSDLFPKNFDIIEPIILFLYFYYISNLIYH